jgi:hypothetical protein
MKTETLFASIFLSLLTCLPVALATPIPGYKNLPEPPLPGDSGVYHDTENKVVHAYYGNNDMEKHMEHVMYNERKHPENKRGFKPTIFSSTDNRNRALRDVKFMPGSARDEKPPNSAIHDGTTTTTRYLPIPESSKQFFAWQLYFF